MLRPGAESGRIRCRGDRADPDGREENRQIKVPYRPIGPIILLLVCLSFGMTAKAAPPLPREQLYALLHEANTAFQAGQCRRRSPETRQPLYEKATLLYEKIIDQGRVQNARLYYNLANAYLLKEDIGRAILNYRRAAKLDGADVNIQKNLAFARSQESGPGRDQRRKTRARDAVLLAL